jgi:hypothetical protein
MMVKSKPLMNLTTEETEELRQLIENEDTSALRKVFVEAVSLGAAVELACFRAMPNGNTEIFGILDEWASRVPVLSAAFKTMLWQIKPDRIDKFAPRRFEFFPVSCSAWDDNDHHLFEGRFDAGLRQSGFGKGSKAFVGAFKEMADNIVQHSGPASQKPAKGIIGYYVWDGCMVYAVGDIGRGVLASLQENPDWQELKDSEEALTAITTKGASRRVLSGEGGGFKQLFRSLADLNGLIILRSGNGLMSIKGSPGGRVSQGRLAIPFPGLQLSVACSLKNEPSEIFVKRS